LHDHVARRVRLCDGLAAVHDGERRKNFFALAGIDRALR
jgi:hypothetical protein